jgi:peptidyl-prolyl cis-trans isomerase C
MAPRDPWDPSGPAGLTTLPASGTSSLVRSPGHAKPPLMSRLVSLGIAAALTSVVATPSANPADDDPIVVRAGTAVLRSRDVERRLARLPRYQLDALGRTPDEARRRFVDSVLVPELLYAEAARERQLQDAPWLRARIREVYHRALRDRLLADSLAEQPITEGDVQAHFEAHRSDFQSEERLLLWRILVDDEALARRILAEARGAGGPERWKQLAREHSRDVATHLRGGELGFVGPDGRTDVPQVRVDPALYAAAQPLADGALAPEPVREGDHYAVVWRRGTRPAQGRALDEVRPFIMDVLERQRAFSALSRLLESLRPQITAHHPERLAALPPDRPDAVGPTAPPADPRAPRSVPPAADPVPRPQGSVLR